MCRRTPAIKGLYAITPDCADTDGLTQRTRRVLAGGASVLQYRNKTASPALRLAQALSLRDLTRSFGVPLIVNDDVDLAAQVDADGVHLGKADVTVESARSLLGPKKAIGVSCYNLPSLARQAAASGADYIAFGAFYPSTVKPEAVQADVGLLRQVRGEVTLPIVAIGGINARNGVRLLDAGADALAVITAVFEAVDTEAAAREFSGLFRQHGAP